MKKFRLNKKGFTLIELMIVIAIIGVLAAIAIPNLIAYRDKSYCSQVESTARSVSAAMANYYAVPSRTAAPSALSILNDLGVDTVYSIDLLATTTANGLPATNIIVKAPNSRCPQDYRTAATPQWAGDGAAITYTLQMR